jgi:hypothetical protein
VPAVLDELAGVEVRDAVAGWICVVLVDAGFLEDLVDEVAFPQVDHEEALFQLQQSVVASVRDPELGELVVSGSLSLE